MEIYLIRHTTPLLSPGLIYGHLDVPLSDQFGVELENVKMTLPALLDAVYSSPSGRCTMLAKEIFPDYQVDNRLRELHFGDWEGKTWDSVDQNDLKRWADDYVNTRVPGGESMLNLEGRVREFWEELPALTYGKIGIVTHAGVIRMMLAIQNKLELRNIFQIRVDYGDVLVVRL